MIPHGTVSGYKNHRCRCDQCRRAASAYDSARTTRVVIQDREAFRELVDDLFPRGLTKDCPAARGSRV